MVVLILAPLTIFFFSYSQVLKFWPCLRQDCGFIELQFDNLHIPKYTDKKLIRFYFYSIDTMFLSISFSNKFSTTGLHTYILELDKDGKVHIKLCRKHLKLTSSIIYRGTRFVCYCLMYAYDKRIRHCYWLLLTNNTSKVDRLHIERGEKKLIKNNIHNV